MAVIQQRTQCALCDADVVANYDHVGDCTKECAGTYAHPRNGCQQSGRDIPHRRTYTTTLGTVGS